MTIKDLKSKEYNSYYQAYIDASGNDDLINGLTKNLENSLSFYNSIPAEKHEYSYDTGKWTVKELLQHLIDSERIFAYRALRIAREDTTNIPGYEHNDYVPVSKANNRNFNDLIEEFELVRKCTIALYNSFDNTMLKSIGTANDDAISVRAIGFIIVGHYNHHQKVVEERYL